MVTPTLHDYQRVAVGHLQRNPRSALFLDMGLGKTAATLSALTPEHLPALVTAPKRVTETVWGPEGRLWRPDLRVGVAAGRRDQRERVLAQRDRYDVVVVGRDNLADAIPIAKDFRTFVIDEMSGFKSWSSRRFKAAKRITRTMPHVIGMTGTPSPNGMMDLWAQMYLLDQGERLGTTLTGFRDRYFTPGPRLPNGVITRWDIRPGAQNRIQHLIEDICLSMTTDGRLDLPPVTFNEIQVPLPPAVRETYRRMKDTLVADLGLLGGEVHTAANAAVLSGKLSQISAGFLYVDDADLRGGQYHVLHREKVQAVQEIVEGTGSPVLVFYRFNAEKDLIRASMPDKVHTIEEPDIIDRWNRGEIPVLLVHPASTGHGLNLQYGGHTIVWSSIPWSLEEWEQANKRLARQGQTQPVVIHVLLSPRTIDAVVLRRLEQKGSVQDALREYLESPL